MAEYWNARAGDHWAESFERYDEILGDYGDAVIAAADPQPDERFLDVGCGVGGPTLEIARRVAPSGSVLGVDLSSQMVARARRRASDAGVDNVEFAEGDVTTYAFEPETFDAYVSRFGVMFFEDPPRAFANLTRSLRPSGRATFACWQDASRNEFMGVPMAAIAKHIAVEPPDPLAPSPFALADQQRVRSLLGSSGLTDVTIVPLVFDQRMGSDAADATEFMMKRETIARLLADAPADVAKAATESVRAALAERERPDGVYLAGAAWLVCARRP